MVNVDESHQCKMLLVIMTPNDYKFHNENGVLKNHHNKKTCSFLMITRIYMTKKTIHYYHGRKDILLKLHIGTI